MNMTCLKNAAALLAALLAAPALAADEAQIDPQQLYREALQSIAEGRKNDASDTLQRVIAREPLHAGAWLDLALIQCALGHRADALRMFDIIIERFAPPPGIVQMIEETRANGCSTWTPQSQYSLSVGRGIDQNVNQGSRANYTTSELGIDTQFDLTPEFRPQHDQYSVFSADYMRDLTPNGTVGYAQFLDRRNDHLHQYDSASLFAGVDVPWRFSAWTVRASALLGLTTLDGQYYQRQYQGQLRVGPPLPLPYKVQFNLLASLTRVEYMTLDNFDAVTGELRAQFSHSSEADSLNAQFGILDDRADRDRPGGNRHGLSASLQWRHRHASGITTDLGYNWQSWRNGAPYAPGIINEVRAQFTQGLRLGVTYPLSKNHSLVLEARAVKNQENISIFQYNGRQLQLSWQWQQP